MPTIVSQTQLDSPVIGSPELYADNLMEVTDVCPTVPEDRSGIEDTSSNTVCTSGIEETLVNHASIPRSYPLWSSSIARKDAQNLYARASDLVISKPSDWIVSSEKKKRKVVDKGCARKDVADPATILLVKKLRHDDLMELHNYFKKKQKVATTLGVSTKIRITTHGLAPPGMTIPDEGNAYVIGGDNATVKEALKESNLEMYNRFEQEDEAAKKKAEKKEVKKLKKEGKVHTLAPYMYS